MRTRAAGDVVMHFGSGSSVSVAAVFVLATDGRRTMVVVPRGLRAAKESPDGSHHALVALVQFSFPVTLRCLVEQRFARGSARLSGLAGASSSRRRGPSCGQGSWL